nr:glutamyl aminopeptidase [Streptococcus oralis]
VIGVVGSIPPHLLSDAQRAKPMEIKNMLIDIGADSYEDAIEIGVKPGQQIVPICPFTPMANEKKIMAKAWDNRYGCGLAIELLKELKDETLPNTLYSGATVQEEVGLRGAQTAANMIQPDIFYALDASPANDASGDKTQFGQLGKGALLRIYDRTMVTHRGMREFILDTAETHNIPYQYFISQGGTDAGRVHTSNSGIPSAVIG